VGGCGYHSVLAGVWSLSHTASISDVKKENLKRHGHTAERDLVTNQNMMVLFVAMHILGCSATAAALFTASTTTPGTPVPAATSAALLPAKQFSGAIPTWRMLANSWLRRSRVHRLPAMTVFYRTCPPLPHSTDIAAGSIPARTAFWLSAGP